MSKLERITVTLPEKMAARLRDWVDAGDYATTSEIVREALRGWADKQDRREAAREQLRAAIAEGEQGPFRDGDAFFDELEAQIQRNIDTVSDAA